MMKITQLSASEYDVEANGKDFHVRREGDEWYVDAFNSADVDANSAHIDTQTFPTFKQAIDWIEESH